MKLNEQIRAHRKKIGLTQEQLAFYLGVSAPAVNKWEKGVTYPDVTLLPPLARLLKIDLNTLFAFHEDLSREEIGRITNELTETLQKGGVKPGFDFARSKLREYPNCELLCYCLALTLDGRLGMESLSPEETAEYHNQVMVWYEAAAAGEDEEAREAAIYMLANKHLAEGELEKALEMAELLPDKRAIDKIMLQINILLLQRKYLDAASMAETKIFSYITAIQSYIIKLVDINLAAGEADTASRLADIQRQMTELFGLWEYNAFVCPLQIAIAAKDVKESISIIKSILKTVSDPGVPYINTDCALYRHLPAKSMDDFAAQLLPCLLHELESDEQYGFLRETSEFQTLINSCR